MTGHDIRRMQYEFLVHFVADQSYSGRVLDFGCGVAPYRHIIERKAQWHGYNRGIYPGGSTEDIGVDEPLSERWEVILCTQMLQYVPDVPALLRDFRNATDKLVLTVATNWPEVEDEDLYRFTRTGLIAILQGAGFAVGEVRQLGAVPFGDREECALGYGVVAT